MREPKKEANGIAPFIAHSPIMSWMHVLFGVQGASYVIGIIELTTAVALIVGPFNVFQKALRAMKDGAETKPLYHAALARTCADWLVGMKPPRAATSRCMKGHKRSPSSGCGPGTSKGVNNELAYKHIEQAWPSQK